MKYDGERCSMVTFAAPPSTKGFVVVGGVSRSRLLATPLVVDFGRDGAPVLVVDGAPGLGVRRAVGRAGWAASLAAWTRLWRWC